MDLRSRIVALLKVLLPLMAIGILSTLFLLSRSVDPTATIPFAEREMADRLRGQQITAPFFSGITDRGDEIIVTACLARPGGIGTPAEATDLEARIIMIDGVRMTLIADTGKVELADNLATFAGNVEITSTSGFIVRTDLLNTALNEVSSDSPGTITGTGPIGDFSAGRMQIREISDGGPLHMVFNDGVKLIYDPTIPER